MKLKLKYYLFTLVFFALIASYACNKFLDKSPSGTETPDVLANAYGVSTLLIAAYADLDGAGGNNGGYGSASSNWSYGSVASDDSYKGSTNSDQGDALFLETWSTLPSNAYISQKWAMMYDGIRRSNDVLNLMRQATDMTAADTLETSAEVRFLRGFYHFELVRVFKNVPYVDESVTYLNKNYNVPNVDASGNYVNIMPLIEADLKYAYDNLKPTQTEIGRVNKSAAEAMLAKCYMYDQNFAGAKTLLDDLIANGITCKGVKFALQNNYFNNFNPDPSAKNSSESVFSVQMSVNDGSADATNTQGAPNGNFGDELNFPYNGGPGGCCGFNNPSQDLANAFKTDAATGLPLLTTFQTGLNVSDPSKPYTGTLDPRVDFVMARKGIPYLDWGNYPGDAWIRDTLNDGHFTPKKNVYALSQKGTLSDATSTYWASVQLTANNTNIIRFSDVLLWAAECEIEVGSLDKALAYVDTVRARIINHPETWTYLNGTFNATSFIYTGSTTLADNYKIGLYPTGSFTSKDYARQVVRFERRLELAMEGQRFFDLQRWDFASPGYMAGILNTYATITGTLRPYMKGVTFTKGKSEIFPIPVDQISIENQSGTVNLKQNPGY